MPGKIEKNLAYAYAADSKASVRNAAFALKAKQEGYPGLARLFRAAAEAESVRTRRFLLLMRGKIGTTEENLKAALQNKTRAGEEYPGMVEEAKKGSTAVKKAFTQSMKTDEEHAERYKKAMNDLAADSGLAYYVCQICGHMEEGSAPKNCPVCHAVTGRFKEIA